MRIQSFFKPRPLYLFGTVVVILFLVFTFSEMIGQTRPLEIKKRDLKKIITLEVARELLVKEVYQDKLGERALFAHPTLKKAGLRIASWRNPNLITVKKDAWFFFVDEQPGANWEHKATYVMVDQENGTIEKIETMSPPVETMAMTPMNEQATAQMNTLKLNVRFLTRESLIGKIQLLKRERYAVLLNGGMNADYNYGRYWNDLSFIYKALKEKYSYTDDEIIVLYANGSHAPSGDLDGNGTNDIDYATTKANLTSVMHTVANRIATDGKFFFYCTNHGGDNPGDYNSNLILWGDSISDSDFAALTKNIKCSQAVYVMEQCFSGGMMDDILKAQTYPCSTPKVCVMTAARHDEPSWGCDTEGPYDEYVYYWTSAVFGKTPAGAVVNADSNHDGKVSMKEAHDYAVAHDSCTEHPQIGSCINTASDVTL